MCPLECHQRQLRHFVIRQCRSDGSEQYFQWQCVTGTYNGATFNGQNRYINVAANDVLGINYSSHVNDAGYLSRNLPVQKLSLLDGVSAPTAAPGKASVFIDAADGSLNVMFGAGVVKTIATDP